MKLIQCNGRDMLRKAIAFRVQRLQWAVLSALRQHVQQQQQEDRERCSASGPRREAVLVPCKKEGGHEWPSRGDEAYSGVDESPNGASGGAMPLQEKLTSEQAVCESALPEPEPQCSGYVMEPCSGNAARSMLEGDLNRAQALHGCSQSSMHSDSSLVAQLSSIKPSSSFSRQDVEQSRSFSSQDVEQSAVLPRSAAPFPERAAHGGSAQSDTPRAEPYSRSAEAGLPSGALHMHEPEEVHETGRRAEPGTDGVRSMRFCSDMVQANASGNSTVGASGQNVEGTGEAELLNQAELDASLAAVFRAWQEATVLQWRRRIGVTEALVRRQRWR